MRGREHQTPAQLCDSGSGLGTQHGVLPFHITPSFPGLLFGQKLGSGASNVRRREAAFAELAFLLPITSSSISLSVTNILRTVTSPPIGSRLASFFTNSVFSDDYHPSWIYGAHGRERVVRVQGNSNKPGRCS